MSAQPGARLDRLTALRAFAALAVFTVHVVPRLDGDPASAMERIASQGSLGVAFFFVLSGFVLAWSHRPGDTARGFWQRRFARIYPAYFVALLGGLAITIAAHGRPGVDPTKQYDSLVDLAGPFAAQAAMVQSWIPNEMYSLSLNGVGWSLSTEAFFYLCFPLIIISGVVRWPSARRVVQVTCLVLICVFWALGDAIDSDWLISQAPFSRLLEFALGVTAALDVLDGRWKRLKLAPCAAFAVCLYLLQGWVTIPAGMRFLPEIAMVAVIVAAANADINRVPGWLRSRPLIWLGEISFCFYLVHQLVIRAMGVIDPVSSWPHAVAVTLVALGASIVAAWALHVIVERPCERRLRGTSRWIPPVTLQPQTARSSGLGLVDDVAGEAAAVAGSAPDTPSSK